MCTAAVVSAYTAPALLSGVVGAQGFLLTPCCTGRSLEEGLSSLEVAGEIEGSFLLRNSFLLRLSRLIAERLFSWSNFHLATLGQVATSSLLSPHKKKLVAYGQF